MRITNPAKLSSTTGLFSRIGTADWRKGRSIAFVVIASLVGVFVVAGKAGIRINMTPSLPVGLYVEAASTSPLVEFCPAEPAASLAARRAYRTQGNCPDGASPLLKPVVAATGDIVEISRAGISVNAHSLVNSAPLIKDTEGRPLLHFPYGRYVVVPGQVWVVSSYNARSFDSRYYGPISTSAIRAHLRPLITQ